MPGIPLYVLITHIYPSNTVYPVYPYIPCASIFTLIVLNNFKPSLTKQLSICWSFSVNGAVVLQAVIVTSQILKSLWEGGEMRGEEWFIKTQYLIVVQMKEEKSIFYILRIYFYFMLRVYIPLKSFSLTIKKSISVSYTIISTIIIRNSLTMKPSPYLVI